MVVYVKRYIKLKLMESVGLSKDDKKPQNSE